MTFQTFGKCIIIKQRMATKKKISKLRFCFIYLVPLAVIIPLFVSDLYYNPVSSNNQFPFRAEFSGKDIVFKMGFSEVPKIIPTYRKLPLLSAIGLPKDLFAYQACFIHNSYFNIKGTRVNSDAVSLDVRVKVGTQTFHLQPNSKLCLDPENNDNKEIYVGDAMNDGNKAAELLELNDKQAIEGKSELLVIEQSIYSKDLMFLGILFTFYPLYWAAIIAWHTVHKLTYK